MSESLTLITITMPSAPSVSYYPFQTQTVHLTTGPDYFRSTDSVTFLGNTIEDISSISNEIDVSQGQGGYATAMHGTVSFADICDGGRLLPLILDGSIPLIGASVFIQSEGDLRYDPITLYLQSPSADSDGILTFEMYSAQYVKGQKLIKWVADRGGVLSNVGVAVGNDPSAIDTANGGYVGRYLGVSVPTEALSEPSALAHPSMSLVGYTGNPKLPGVIHYGEAIAPENKLPTVDDGVHRTFQYEFPSQALRDSWFAQHYGNPTSTTDFGTLDPYMTTIITDGTSIEFILFTSAEGKIYYAQNVSSDGLPVTVLQKGTVAGSSPTIYTVDAICSDNSALRTASLDSIKIYELKATNPICTGASSVVGYQSKADNASEYGVTKPLQLVYDSAAGTLANKDIIIDGVLNFCPAFPTANNSFYAVTKTASDIGITYNNYSVSVPGTKPSTITFNSSVNAINTDTVPPTNNFTINLTKIQESAVPGNTYTLTLSMTLLHNIGDEDTNISVDKVYFDVAYNVSLSSYNHMWHLKWIDPFRSSAQIDLLTPSAQVATLASVPSMIPFRNADHSFNSFSDAQKNATSWVGSLQYDELAGFTLTESISNIVAYIGTKLAYGSNPAVVIPAAFPDTTDLTTTPVLTIGKLASYAGIAAKPLIGSKTTYPSAWGRYIAPTSTVNDTIASIAKESWLFANETRYTDAIAPDAETLNPIEYKVGNLEDVVTEPSFKYDMAGTDYQFAATISHVDEPFSMDKGSGYFWSGWQEKDTIGLGNACKVGGTITATGVLNDCIACTCTDGTLYCSFDGGNTWPVSQSIVPSASASSMACIVCGNGIMVATIMNHSSYSFAYYSVDYGRSWNPIATINGTAVSGGALNGIAISFWFDNVNKVLYLGGQSSTGYAQVYMTANGADFTTINITPDSTNLSGAVYSIAVRGNPTANVYIAVGITGQPELLASAQGGAAGTWYAKTGVPSTQHIQYFGNRYRIFNGNTLWSSENLIDWGSAAVTYSFTNCATSSDGKLIIGYVDAADFWYSRDSGNNWQLVSWPTDEYAGTPGWLWDDHRGCFICPTIIHTTILSVGDPAVYQLWNTCRNAYLTHGVVNSQEYEWPSIYNASDIIDMLNVTDGIDSSITASRINWLCYQPRYVEMSVVYNNASNQLSVSSGQRIVIPTQRIVDSGIGSNIPTYGIITSVEHIIKSGITKLQITMPPVV